jgi:hypothetical protein
MDRSGFGRKCHVIKGTNPGESFGNAGEMQGSTHEYYDPSETKFSPHFLQILAIHQCAAR